MNDNNSSNLQRGIGIVVIIGVFCTALALVSLTLTEFTLKPAVTGPSGSAEPNSGDPIDYRVEPAKVSHLLPELDLQYPARGVDTYHVALDRNEEFTMHVVTFVDADENEKRATLFFPQGENGVSETAAAVTTDQVMHTRYLHWSSAAAAIRKHTPRDARFFAYWDNAQRIELLSGRDTWVSLPDPAAYANQADRKFWQEIAGGADRSGKLNQLVDILMMDYADGVQRLRQLSPANDASYLLVSTDDLSHIQEFARLAGRGFPLETRLFPTDSDLHSGISRIKDWASEGDGTGSYLVHSVSQRLIRAWRITDPAFENTLLVRLLPFISSIDQPDGPLKLVFQSDWGGYLRIYRI